MVGGGGVGERALKIYVSKVCPLNLKFIYNNKFIYKQTKKNQIKTKMYIEIYRSRKHKTKQIQKNIHILKTFTVIILTKNIYI